MTSTHLTPVEHAQQELVGFLKGGRLQRLERALKGKHDTQQFVRLLLGSCRDEKATLKLLNCDHMSIYRGALAALDYGLIIGGPASEASLVPFAGKAVLIVEYRGWRRLARRSPEVEDVVMESVHVGDKFKFKNTRSEPEHEYSDSKTRRTDPVVGAYAIVYFANGRVKSAYWSVEECKSHRDQYSPSWKHDKSEDNIWHEKNPSFSVMCRKTVLLDMCHRGDCPIELSDPFVQATGGGPASSTSDDDDGILEAEIVESVIVEDEPESAPVEPEPAPTKTKGRSETKKKPEGPTFKFSGIRCPNLDQALKNVRSLAKVGVIREHALKQAENADEREYIIDTCKVREADIREARTKKANEDVNAPEDSRH